MGYRSDLWMDSWKGPFLKIGRVSPAHAGIVPYDADIAGYYDRFPRTRGDSPGSAKSGRRQWWFPPHTRG